MRRLQTVIVVLFVLSGAWMVFDGGRALVVGDYVRPQSGQYAGQLGPWASLVATAGLDPLSTTVKLAMVACGTGVVVAGSVSLLSGFRAAAPLAAAAIAGLWYAPFGTLTGVGVLAVIAMSRRRRQL